MTANRRFAPAVVAAALAVGVTACSGGAPAAEPATAAVAAPSSTPASTSSHPGPTTTTSTAPAVPVDAAFAKKAEAICTEWVSAATAHQYDGAGGLAAATPPQLPAVATFLDAQPVIHEGQPKLSGLGTPPSGQARWATVVAAVGAFQTAAGQAVSAARTGDATAWATAFEAYESAKDTVHHDLLDAGFKGNGSCALLFERSSGH